MITSDTGWEKWKEGTSWYLRPYDKTNDEVTRIPRMTVAYHKLREETKGWGDYKKLPEEIPEFL